MKPPVGGALADKREIEQGIFRQVYDAYPDGVLLVDAQGLIQMANPAVTALLGYQPGDLLGRPVDMLVPDSVAARHAAYRHGYAREPRARPMGTHLDLKAKCADGSEVMVEISLSPLQTPASSGQAANTYVVVAVRGTGAYPRVKQALQRARYNEFVVQLGQVAVDTADPDELLQGIPRAVAQALEVPAVAVLLLSSDELTLSAASHWGDLALALAPSPCAIRPDTLAGHVLAQRAPVRVDSFAKEQRFAVPAALPHSGMQSGLAVPLVDRGRVVGVLAAWAEQVQRFGDDELAFLQALASLLSTSLQRAQAEQQLRHAQRLESVGQLTGGIAHDFNNLLTVIQGNLQMLADLPALQAHSLAPQLLAAATRAGQRGADLTGKLLAFSRRQPLAPVPLDPAAMLLSLADMLRRTLGDHIQVQVSAAPDLPPCLADPVQLESALLNVAINARDAIQAGLQTGQTDTGVLQLRCSGMPMPEADDAAWLGTTGQGTAALAPSTTGVCFTVQDNGCGMAAHVQARAFEPFFTTKAAGRGTGLGLSTVYGFVMQSQGRLRLDSSVGGGTQVSFVLPALALPSSTQPVAGATLTTAPGPRRVPTGLRVLLVEDEPDVRAVSQSFLQQLGCVVQACANAPAALALLPAGAAETTAPTFDVLFSDIILGPGANGMELARQAQQRHPRLAVLLCSGFSPEKLRPESSDTPAWPVLKKPFTLGQLEQALGRVTALQQGPLDDAADSAWAAARPSPKQ
jgi:PAS domain S-box-containing protein